MSDNERKKLPAAGCSVCGSSAWILVLDDFPPNHTKIVAFVCSGYDPELDKRTLCGYHMKVDILLADAQDMSDREEIVDNED